MSYSSSSTRCSLVTPLVGLTTTACCCLLLLLVAPPLLLPAAAAPHPPDNTAPIDQKPAVKPVPAVAKVGGEGANGTAAGNKTKTEEAVPAGPSPKGAPVAKKINDGTGTGKEAKGRLPAAVGAAGDGEQGGDKEKPNKPPQPGSSHPKGCKVPCAKPLKGCLVEEGKTEPRADACVDPGDMP